MELTQYHAVVFLPPCTKHAWSYWFEHQSPFFSSLPSSLPFIQFFRKSMFGSHFRIRQKRKKKCQKKKIRSASWTRLSYSQICSSCKDINILVHSEGKGRHRGPLSQSLKFKYSSNCIPTHCLGSNKHTHFTRLHTYSGLLSSTPNQFCLVTTGWTEDLDFNFKAWMRKQESLKQSRRVERITPALLRILPNL